MDKLVEVDPQNQDFLAALGVDPGKFDGKYLKVVEGCESTHPAEILVHFFNSGGTLAEKVALAYAGGKVFHQVDNIHKKLEAMMP